MGLDLVSWFDPWRRKEGTGEREKRELISFLVKRLLGLRKGEEVSPCVCVWRDIEKGGGERSRERERGGDEE